jgi:hypothetical protein
MPIAHSGADYLLAPKLGVLVACMQVPYKFKNSYGAGFAWQLPAGTAASPDHMAYDQDLRVEPWMGRAGRSCA